MSKPKTETKICPNCDGSGVVEPWTVHVKNYFEPIPCPNCSGEGLISVEIESIVGKIDNSVLLAKSLRDKGQDLIHMAPEFDDVNYMRLLNHEATQCRLSAQGLEKELSDYLTGLAKERPKQYFELANHVRI